jgi:hypothetical protein
MPEQSASTTAGDTSGKTPGQPSTGDGAPSGQVISVTAQEFYDAFEKDKDAATKRFRNAVVEVTGVIENLAPQATTPPQGLVVLKAGKVGAMVACQTTDPEPWKKVSVEQKVKIKGVLPEEVFDERLVQCELVDLQPQPTPILSAEKLASAYAADRKGTIAKHEAKLVAVTGVVADKKAAENGGALISLKGKDKVAIVCGFTPIDKDESDPIKPGQHLTVLGQAIGGHDDSRFLLTLCHVIKNP